MSFRTTVVAALAVLAVGAAAPARAWPTQPVRLVVPFTPGTGIDLIARQLAARLPERLGQPVLVDNRPGASGNLGTEAVARAQPDGHTLLVTVNTFVMNRSLYRKVPYEPARDFAPITLAAWGSLLLTANPQAGAQTVPEALAAARAQPGTVPYGSPGVGTPHHLAMALLEAASGTDFLHVPYTGTAGAVTDLIGGRTHYMFLPVHVALPHAKSGKLRALAIGSPQRASALPEVPTLGELGLGEVDVEMWYGVLAPRGTPPAVVARLNQEIRAALSTDDARASFATQGMQPAFSTPEEFGRLIERDQVRWARVVARAKISAD